LAEETIGASRASSSISGREGSIGALFRQLCGARAIVTSGAVSAVSSVEKGVGVGYTIVTRCLTRVCLESTGLTNNWQLVGIRAPVTNWAHFAEVCSECRVLARGAIGVDRDTGTVIRDRRDTGVDELALAFAFGGPLVSIASNFPVSLTLKAFGTDVTSFETSCRPGADET